MEAQEQQTQRQDAFTVALGGILKYEFSPKSLQRKYLAAHIENRRIYPKGT